MRELAALISLLAVATASACGSDGEPAQPSPPRDQLLVAWERGGGIAGIGERLEI